MLIPRIIHQLWVGPKEPPHEMMATWREQNPGWAYVLWTEKMVRAREWMNQRLIDSYFERGIWHGVADVARYEILFEYGGFYPGADTKCLMPIGELFEDDDIEAYSVYENEKVRPGLISPLHACVPKAKFAARLINGLLHTEPGEPWKTTGNMYMARRFEEDGARVRIWPSHYFIPEHYTGERYDGPGPVYATHEWGDLTRRYADRLKKKT